MKETLVSLCKNREFRRVYKYGRRVSFSYGTVFFQRNALPHNRFGLSVSKKVGGSVCRHRVKRLFLESLRRQNKYMVQGFDVVVNAKKSAVGMDYHSCYRELERVMRRQRMFIQKKGL